MTSRSPIDFASTDVHSARDPSQKIKFGALWAERPVVIGFLRRLGCQICRVQAQDLEAVRADVEQLGGSIVCLSTEYFGQGSDVDRSFEAGGYFRGDIWTDKDKALYSQLLKRKGITNNFFGVFDTSKVALGKIKDRNVKGNFQNGAEGLQLGGTFVIAPGGRVVLDHRQKFYGDDPTPEAILDAIKNALGTSSSGGEGAAPSTTALKADGTTAAGIGSPITQPTQRSPLAAATCTTDACVT